MKTVLTVVAGVALSAALAFPHAAQANLILNGSGNLETTLTPDQYGLVTASTTVHPNAITGWTITSGSVDIVPNSYWQSALGTYSVDLIGSPGIGKISQTVATTIGDNYLLTFDFSVNPENLTGEAISTKHLVVTATSSGSTVDGTNTYSGTLNATDTGLSTSMIPTASTRTKTNMEYVTESFTFTATSSSTTLSLAAILPTGLSGSFNSSNVFCGPVVDNLDLEDTGSSTPPVPEPASLALLGAGALVFLRRRR